MFVDILCVCVFVDMLCVCVFVDMRYVCVFINGVFCGMTFIPTCSETVSFAPGPEGQLYLRTRYALLNCIS